jgi:hypothetical protein
METAIQQPGIPINTVPPKAAATVTFTFNGA